MINSHKAPPDVVAVKKPEKAGGYERNLLPVLTIAIYLTANHIAFLLDSTL